jgi:C terminal of Calcineurin-like phosphoesterase
MQLLSDRTHCVSFSGHSHTTEHHYLGAEEGFLGKEPHHHHVLTAACGSWWSGPSDLHGVPVSDSRDGSPRGVHVLSVDGSTYTTRFVPSVTAASPQLRAMLVNKRALDLETGQPMLRNPTSMPIILVDVFDGGPRTRVVCKINGLDSPEFELVRNAVCDPHIVDAYAKYKTLCKPWVAPACSSHIWIAALPECVVAGTYDCTIHVVSEYGEELEVRQSINVTA